MHGEQILQTHAEVAMALGGFAAVAAALGRPLNAARRQRFIALLFLALTQVLACLIPVWLSGLLMTEAALWRTASLVYLLIATVVISFAVILPYRNLDRASAIVLNPAATRLLNTLSALSVLLLPFNAIGIPWGPALELYYASLLLAFSGGFILFADVVLMPEDRT